MQRHWNLVVIIVGLPIAIIGLLNGFFTTPVDNVFRQAVQALWVLQGLVGLLIAAVGVTGESLMFMATAFLPEDQNRKRNSLTPTPPWAEELPSGFAAELARKEERLRELGNRPASR